MPVVGFMNMIGPTELLLVLVIVLILFGAGRLPQVFEQFGKGLRAFRDAQKEEPIDVTRASDVRKELSADALSEAEEIAEKTRTGTRS
ncbi:MAG: twin-arginine translocase TatA/TatE family subunit [Myxococcota bacterium]